MSQSCWTPEQLSCLRQLRRLGASMAEIAVVVGHSPKACEAKACALRILLPRELWRLPHKWTRAQIADVKRRRGRGESLRAIGRAIGRSRKAVEALTRRERIPLGAPPPKPKARKKPASPPRAYTLRNCLRCRSRFRSDGPHHRLCNRCRREARDVLATTHAVVVPHRRWAS